MNHLIYKVRAKLTEQACKNGLSENFGVKEVNKLYDNPKNNPYGTLDERQFNKEVQDFERWCYNYSL